jgi:hypothetical protein
MEINELVGYKLQEIRKTGNQVKLFFKNQQVHKEVELSFRGFLFETSILATNRNVSSIELGSATGFRAITLLRREQLNPEEYRQLFIQMSGSSEENKIELICVFTSYRLISINKSSRVHTEV